MEAGRVAEIKWVKKGNGLKVKTNHGGKGGNKPCKKLNKGQHPRTPKPIFLQRTKGVWHISNNSYQLL